MKLKALVLATALVAASFSGSASALNIQGVEGYSTGSYVARNADLVLTIYDAARDVSFVQDLGSSYNFNSIITQVKAGTFSGSFNLDAAGLTTAFSATANKNNLLWTLSTARVDDMDYWLSGFVSTSNSPAALRDDPNVALDATGIAIAGAKFGALAAAAYYNSVPAGSPGVSATGVAGSVLSQQVFGYGQGVTYSFNFANAAKANVAQDLYFWGEDLDGLAVASTKASANAWVLDLSNLSNATLSSAPVDASTPLPAAAWLMFSALMGLGGIARRRNNV